MGFRQEICGSNVDEPDWYEYGVQVWDVKWDDSECLDRAHAEHCYAGKRYGTVGNSLRSDQRGTSLA